MSTPHPAPLAVCPRRDAFRADVLAWILSLRAEFSSRGGGIVVGITAPQGAGKTTLVRELEVALGAAGVRAIGVSIDDFYWTRSGQQALAAAHPGNRYLQQRGHPGTHDVALGARVIDTLRTLAPGATCRVPVYHKSAHGGLGDRAPEAAWRSVTGPVDVLILEGWMLGFRPVGPRALADDPSLGEVDGLLSAYEAWDNRLDALLHLVMADPSSVVAWRCEAEDAVRAAGKPALSPAATRAYVELFLPAYAVWPAALEASPPVPRVRVVRIGRDRLPVSAPR